MASFDIENLFTNVHLREIITICLNYFFTSPGSTSTVIGLTRGIFRILLQHAVLNFFFIFDSKLHKQIDGSDMGPPLGPTIANIFMSLGKTLINLTVRSFLNPRF